MVFCFILDAIPPPPQKRKSDNNNNNVCVNARLTKQVVEVFFVDILQARGHTEACVQPIRRNPPRSCINLAIPFRATCCMINISGVDCKNKK